MSSAAGKNNRASSGAMKAVRSAIGLLLGVVFLGYLMIWFMMPTNIFYLRWLPKIHAKTNSTFFGEQGGNTLVYMFPILFIATMACIYLHLGKKIVDDDADICSVRVGSRFASWKRAVLVRGPLGIVTWIELSFLLMFVASLLWSSFYYLHEMFATVAQLAAQEGLQVWEAQLQSTGLTLGLVGYISLAFLFFPVTRGSSILPLLGLTSEASIKYHIWLGHASMTLFTAHGLIYIIFWAKTHQLSQMLKWDKLLVSNVAGEIALVSGLIMWVTSLKCIRRKIFELFLYSHHLYVLFVAFFVFHVGFSSSCIVLPGFYLFLVDRCLRFLQSQQRVRLVAARILPNETVELNFSKALGLRNTPRSTVFINVPSISKLQWHPFTVTSSSKLDPENLSVVIKSEGSWTHKLYHMLSSPSQIDHLKVSIEGPYGPVSSDFMRHDMLVMVSGGSGITPFISIIREILFTANNENGGRSPRVLLICCFKKSVDLSMLDLLLPLSGTNLDISRLQLQVEAYITRENEPRTESQIAPRTIWLKPDASDAPVSAILGHNNWLWLGAIVAASFIIFLLLIAILTRYYIYPIDHNTNMLYPASTRSLLNMFSICLSITITASAGFLWNKKQIASEANQIQNISTPSPVTSPDSDLESLSRQHLLQCTQVHYGRTPNLKNKILECKGESVGVLVSGPRSMRQEVATICSSDLALSLHFESISFSW